MRVAVNGSRLTQDWVNGVISAGAKPAVKVAPPPRTVWNGNPYCLPGCVLHFPGLPGTGSTIYDYSGKGNNGAITGATWTRLPSGHWYLSFDGTNDKITVTETASLQIAGNLTVEFWFKLTATGRNQMVDKYPASRNGWFILINVGLFYWPLATDSSNYISAKTVSTYNDGVWHHGVFTRSGATSNIIVDGVSDYSVYESVGTLGNIQFTSNIVIGETLAGADDLNGSMALIRLYNRALSIAEGQNHYQQERHLFGV